MFATQQQYDFAYHQMHRAFRWAYVNSPIIMHVDDDDFWIYTAGWEL